MSKDKKSGLWKKLFGKTSPIDREIAEHNQQLGTMESQLEDLLDRQRDSKQQFAQADKMLRAKMAELKSAPGPTRQTVLREIENIKTRIKTVKAVDSDLQGGINRLQVAIQQLRRIIERKSQEAVADADVLSDIAFDAEDTLETVREANEAAEELARIGVEDIETMQTGDTLNVDDFKELGYSEEEIREMLGEPEATEAQVDQPEAVEAQPEAEKTQLTEELEEE